MNRQRPGALTAIAVIGIILGSLGVCGGGFGAVSPFFQDRMNALSREMTNNQPGATPEMIEGQNRFQDAISELSRSFRPLLVGSAMLNLLSSLALLAGSIFLLRWDRRAPGFFSGALIACIVVDVIAGAVNVYFQLRTSDLMQEYMATMGSAIDAPGADRTFGAIGMASAGAGFCMTGAWLLLKLGYYVTSLLYVRRPEVRAAYAAS